VLGLDGELAGFGFGHCRVCPELVENIKLEVAARRFLDHGAVGTQARPWVQCMAGATDERTNTQTIACSSVDLFGDERPDPPAAGSRSVPGRIISSG
jgi:hypothetical protein